MYISYKVYQRFLTIFILEEKIAIFNDFYLTSERLEQLCFKPTGSTTAALVYTIHHVTKLLESNSYVRCLLVDFSKVFEIVDHAIIVRKLSTLPLPWNIINWFISFLSNRKIILKIGNSIFQPRRINRGIVQGSGIGRSLYIVHESDLTALSLPNILITYADDTNLLVPENSDISISRELDNIKIWAIHNKMIINFSKTKEIVFHRPNPHHFLHPHPPSNGHNWDLPILVAGRHALAISGNVPQLSPRQSH